MSLSKGIVLDLQRYYAPLGPTAPPAATWADLSRYKTDGTITGAAWVRQPNGLYALDFNGATPDFVGITAPQMNFIAGDFSFVFRMKPALTAAEAMIFDRGVFNTDGYWIRFDADARVLVNTFQAAATQLTYTNANAIVAGTMSTIGVSRSGANVYIYKNGVNDVAVSGSHINPTTAARTVRMGADRAGTRPYTGVHQLVLGYSRSLSAGEHKQIHDNLVRQ